ncbi:MAG: TetR family transcriptional regulator [Bradyrhizobiaceae bacterium]|nr:MAG: TetR family transcriptional regulator [Bradyrhizobiaceae bacterium]GIK82503.1 MAG: TetR family transcriptional regulator [Alphaproteobacteria bacterium]
MTAADRRQALREGLIAAAGQAIAAEGLAGLRARDLARDVGCALGAIYNVFADLDDLVLAVNARTLAVLERDLARARPPGDPQGAEAAIAALEALALAYADFAAANMLRWRAVFDHRLPRGRSVPDWYVSEQARLFDYVAAPLRALQPRLVAAERALLARSLFSAVHGVVVLGLEEKLQAMPREVLRRQVATVVTALARGLRDPG